MTTHQELRQDQHLYHRVLLHQKMVALLEELSLVQKSAQFAQVEVPQWALQLELVLQEALLQEPGRPRFQVHLPLE